MNITHQSEKGTFVVCISDELGHHEARRAIDYIENMVALYPSRDMVLDLSGLKFMDSSGLAVVMNLYRALTRGGRELVVRNAPEQAMRVFDAAGLPRLIRFIQKEG